METDKVFRPDITPDGSGEKFTLGGPVHRGNLMSFFLESFAKSRGRIIAQRVYLEYALAACNIRPTDFLNGYFNSGGSEIFSVDEKSQAELAYERVKKHENGGDFWSNWDLELKEMLTKINESERKGESPYGHLADLPKPHFLRALGEIVANSADVD